MWNREVFQEDYVCDGKRKLRLEFFLGVRIL